MFLSHRSRQAECFDEPDRPRESVLRDYAQLERLNRLFRHADPFTRRIARDHPASRWQKARVLEVGAGSGQLSLELQSWASQQGWSWDFTCLDLNPCAIDLNPIPHKCVGDATRLPFPDQSFDLVIASQMTHHLDEAGVIAHFHEAWRVAKHRVLISDLHRNAFLFTVIALIAPWLGVSRRLLADGLLSVRKGFRVGEWHSLATQAGIRGARVSIDFGCRIVLDAVKPPAPNAPHGEYPPHG